jgi:hypothetical protein
MMSRVLKRPMFKMGGDVENVGIMDGMRQRYAEAGSVGTQIPGMKTGSTEITMDYRPQQMDRGSFLTRPGLSPFLIDFGLNLLASPGRGNIFQASAIAARDPFKRLMDRQAAAAKTARDFETRKKLIEFQEAQKAKYKTGPRSEQVTPAFENLQQDKAELIKDLLPRGLQARADDASAKIIMFRRMASEEDKRNFIGLPTYITTVVDGQTQYVPNTTNIQVGQIFYDVVTGQYKKRVSSGNSKQDFETYDPFETN